MWDVQNRLYRMQGFGETSVTFWKTASGHKKAILWPLEIDVSTGPGMVSSCPTSLLHVWVVLLIVVFPSGVIIGFYNDSFVYEKGKLKTIISCMLRKNT